MGTFGKIVLLCSIGIVGGVAGLRSVGAQLQSEFAAQSTAETAAIGSQPNIAAPLPLAAPNPAISPSGETIYEQAIFDAFPAASPSSRTQKRKVSQASDFVRATINSNGHLCARLLEMQKAADGLYGIGCVTRRDGYGRSNYLLNIRTGAVSEI